MAISLQVASAIRISVRGTPYLPSPAVTLAGEARASASADEAAASAVESAAFATAADASADEAAATAAGLSAALGSSFVTSVAEASLPGEVVLTDTSSLVWDRSTPGQIKGTASAADGSITMAKLANIATNTLIGRSAAGTGVPETLTGSAATSLLASLAGTGQVIRSWYAETATMGATTGSGIVIPFDDTLPQSTEGLQLLTIPSVATLTATNKLRIRFYIPESCSAVDNVTAAVFNGGSNAIGATAQTQNFAGHGQFLTHEFDFVPGDTTARTYSLRVGISVSTNTLTVNGASGARYLGGAFKTTLTIEEIKA